VDGIHAKPCLLFNLTRPGSFKALHINTTSPDGSSTYRGIGPQLENVYVAYLYNMIVVAETEKI